MPIIGTMSCEERQPRDRRDPVGRVGEAVDPQRLGICPGVAVGIEGVDRVVLGGDEGDVVHGAVDRQARHVQRLGVDVAVDRLREEQAEVGRVHIRRRECRLVEVVAREVRIVVVLRDVHAAEQRATFQWREQGTTTVPST